MSVRSGGTLVPPVGVNRQRSSMSARSFVRPVARLLRMNASRPRKSIVYGGVGHSAIQMLPVVSLMLKKILSGVSDSSKNRGMPTFLIDRLVPCE